MTATDIRMIHQGEYLSFYEIEYQDDFGHNKTYEMVSRTGSRKSGKPPLTLDTIGKELNAIVLFILNEDHTKTLLPTEFRMGVNQYVIGNIAGLIEPGETVEEAARRELFEETGLTLTKIEQQFAPAYVCSGVTDEAGTLLICTVSGDICPSDSIYEEIHARWVTKEEAQKILRDKAAFFSSRSQILLWMWANNKL